MRFLLKRKDAISPIVATLLLLALTVASVTFVYFVIVPLAQPKIKVEFDVSNVDNFMDYDHDGTIDATTVNITIASTFETGPVNMTDFGFELSRDMLTYHWQATPAGVQSIDEGDSGEVVISSISEDEELLEGESYTLRVFIGENEATYPFVAGTATLGPLVTISVNAPDLEPVHGALVDLYYANDAIVGTPTKITPINGQIQVALKVGEYKARAKYYGQEYWSNGFAHPKVSTVTIQIGLTADMVRVHVQNPLGGMANVPVYAFDSLGRYQGIHGTTNEDGDVFLSVAPGSYVFKAFYLGVNFSSPLIEYPQTTEVTITVGEGMVYGRVMDSDGIGQQGYRVYLFSSGGSYLGRSGRTNETGYVAFNLLAGTYKFRVDYGGARSWSEVFGAADGTVITISIGGKVYAHVIYGADEAPLANVRVYLFTAGGSYTGLSARTNSTGYARFNSVISTSTFKFRVDYAGGRFWSTTFDGALPIYVLDINIGGRVFCYVHNDGTPLSGVRVYLFRESGSYSGLSAKTNSTGYAQFNGVLNTTNYCFRVDYSGNRYWSAVFDGSIDKLVVSVDVSSSAAMVNCFGSEGVMILRKEIQERIFS